MSIRITELDAITSLQSGDYIAVDNESTGTHKFDALNIGSNIGQNIANTYSSSASYAIGQYCLYDNNLYKCTTTISTPEAWNSSHWIQVTVGEGLYEKVDKVSGKGLSTNDFTNEYKQKLGGIEAGAEVNVQANWAETNTSSDSYIKNKPGNATTEISGFMSASDKQKLDNIEAGAEVNVQPNWAEDDSSKDDYIKNKPTIDTALSISSDNAVRNSAITAGINQVQGNLDTEITNRQNAVSGEQLARENADSALDGRLDTVEETLPNKANINGSYEEMTVGSAEQLISTESIEDTTLYTFRASGGGIDIGDRETDKLVGGTVAWNQLVSAVNAASEVYGITRTMVDGGKRLKYTGTSQQGTNFTATTISEDKIIEGHKYFVTLGDISLPSGVRLSLASNDKQTSMIRPLTQSQRGWGVIINSGVQVDFTACPQTFDLTQMFGSTIADALYAMEQAEAGTGIAWFRKYFPKPYYAYDSGSLQSVNVASHDMTGFNQWDEVWEVGTIDGNGQNASANDRIRSKNYILCLPSTSYFISIEGAGATSQVFYYDADKNYISNVYSGDTFGVLNTPANAYYMRFRLYATYGTTYNHDICINRVWTGNRNGEYEPYELHSYAYDETVELRGIPSLVDGELVYDGDIYEADGTVNRKYGYVDLGTLTWETANANGQTYSVSLRELIRNGSATGGYGNQVISAMFVGTEAASMAGLLDGQMSVDSSGNLQICKTSFASYTNEQLKTAMSGAYLVYELATPTSEQATGFTNPQVVDAFGTEEYVDAGVKNETRDVSIPVGHETQYMANLRDKLQHLPNLAKEDGDYFVNQTGTQMKLKKVEGYYEDLVVGVADNLNTDIRTNDQTPYLFRTAGGSVDIGDREYINGIVGGTVAFNQLVQNGDFSDGTNKWSGSKGTISASNGVLTFTNTDAPTSAYSNKIVQTATTNLVITNHKYVWLGMIRSSRAVEVTGALTGCTNANNASTHIVASANKWEERGMILKANTSSHHETQVYYNDDYANVQVGDTLEVKNVMVIDLTQMFGSTIADYIYSLEQATAGAGVAFFKSLFPKPYYAYNSGELKSVKGLVSHDMVGFNQLEEQPVIGARWNNDGTYSSSGNNDYAASPSKVKCVPNTSYCISFPNTSVNLYAYFMWFDANGDYIGGSSATTVSSTQKKATFTTSSDAYYFALYIYRSGWSTASDIVNTCINLSWDGSRDGEYEPYQKWSYPLDSDLELRGIPKIENGNLYYDGDIYENDGTVTRKYGIITLDGTERWDYYQPDATLNQYWYTTPTSYTSGKVLCACDKYAPIALANRDNNFGTCYIGTNSICFNVDSTAFPTLSDWKTYLGSNNVTVVYPLATPTTETADPYTNPQIVNDFGTEEFVIDSEIAVPIPVGHDTDYPINLKSKLEMAPDSPDGDGDYIVRQTNGTNEYVPLIIEDQLPAVPSTDGTYTLTVTIASGEATYSWT